MATYDYTKSTNTNGVATGSTFTQSGSGRLKVLTNTIDLTQAPDALAAADVLKVLTIPAGYVLRAAFLKVVTAAGAVQTFSMGDSGGAATVMTASKDMNAAAGTIYGSDGSSFVTTGNVITVGKAYTAADYLSITLAGAGAGKKGVYAIHAELMQV